MKSPNQASGQGQRAGVGRREPFGLNRHWTTGRMPLRRLLPSSEWMPASLLGPPGIFYLQSFLEKRTQWVTFLQSPPSLRIRQYSLWLKSSSLLSLPSSRPYKMLFFSWKPHPPCLQNLSPDHPRPCWEAPYYLAKSKVTIELPN